MDKRAVMKAARRHLSSDPPVPALRKMCKVIEVVEVVKTVYENKADSHAQKNWWIPPPWVDVGVRIACDGIPERRPIDVPNDLPRPVTLQARPARDFLHHAVDLRALDHSAAGTTVLRRRLIVGVR